jgi:preprotein translocase subunit SecA
MFGFLRKIFGTAQDRLVRQYRRMVKDIREREKALASLTNEQLKAKTDEFRNRIQGGEHVDSVLPEAYAVVSEACRRMIGTEIHVSGYDQAWDMIPYDVQLIGAIGMHHGTIAEMRTGEGKTLTAALPLYLNALTGQSVHLVTVNDYLASRDCEWVGSVLRWLGLNTAALTNGVHPHERKDIYAADVVYGTASEFGFDYLRDNSMAMSHAEQVQRGYHFAIIDEIDSILIDEARTPLIISGPVPQSRQMYQELKGGVDALVRVQRDYSNRLATEARKALQELGVLEDETLPIKEKVTKQERPKLDEACQKLWLISKGTPHNKILRRTLEHPDLRAEIDQWDLYYYNDQNKQEKADALGELFIIIDERSSEYELTDKGIGKWAEYSSDTSSDDFVMFDLGAEYLTIDEDTDLDDDAKMDAKADIRQQDADRKEKAHNLRQMLRAHLLMEKDVDYIIQNEKIVIIDENTGRPQPGRRFSDGLHQAIEAKEGLKIQKETQTYATITLQNYFRMYDKIAGMTGTALTEAGEFKEIYKLEVLEIPTNRPEQRNDANDEIYMTEREKYNAILVEVREVHEKGRPILIGTESVEISEKLSRIFKLNKLEHTVLNARHHDQEAEVIAAAGRHGAITIATNMAGRGTDIKLGENIAQLGGLNVIGTTRHQSRRIDRQLRGRCARQGDPGTSKFYVSFEDSLMRLFASPKLTAMLQRFRPPEGEPISARILNRSIETAQKRVEQRNYTMRKHTLEYDDVMNKQRQEIYAFRNEILTSLTIREVAVDVIETLCVIEAEKFFQNRGDELGWNPEGYRQWLLKTFPVSFDTTVFDQDLMEVEEIEKIAIDKIVSAFQTKMDLEDRKVLDTRREGSPSPSVFPSDQIVRGIMLRKLDRLWQEHLLTMDHLRSEVNLRAVAQRDPLMEFKHEAFALFHTLGQEIRQEIASDLFRFQIIIQRQENPVTDLLNQYQMESDRSLLDEPVEPSDGEYPELAASATTDFSQGFPQAVDNTEFESSAAVATEQRAGRNDPCPCGSGKKHKKCCGKDLEN